MNEAHSFRSICVSQMPKRAGVDQKDQQPPSKRPRETDVISSLIDRTGLPVELLAIVRGYTASPPLFRLAGGDWMRFTSLGPRRSDHRSAFDALGFALARGSPHQTLENGQRWASVLQIWNAAFANGIRTICGIENMKTALEEGVSEGWAERRVSFAF